MHQHHRIAVQNDFRNTYAFIDWLISADGQFERVNASCSRGPMPTRQKPDDCITIWVNYEKVRSCKTTFDAATDLYILACRAPSKEFYEFLETLLEALK